MITEYRTRVLVPQSSPKDAFSRHGAKFGDAADECIRPKVWGDRPWEAGCSGRGPSISAAVFREVGYGAPRRRVRLGSRRNDSALENLHSALENALQETGEERRSFFQ